ncbi:cytochrome P450 4C1-like isoform X1 [Daphnia magna]|uniref:cytochrome P450 4C1-like isoform X1 n=1 Tax=Daphnia magna TaxID=35525 RepID=UPI001E1BC753|nr:cytochrome P450 4C1-like isoform X1 [Daphnia magna]
MAVNIIPAEFYSLLPNSLTVFTSVAFVLVSIIVTALYRHYKYFQRCNKIPGPPAQIPFVGSFTEFLIEPEEIVPFFLKLHKTWNKYPVTRLWIGPLAMFSVSGAEGAEVVLSSNKIIDKSREYNFIQPWLGTGLLTSTGSKWHQRRKMLTPTFHFKILEEFIRVFNEQSAVLVEKLNETVNQPFDIFPFITRCTLDIICETAMGCQLNAQTKSDSDYVQAVYKMSRIVHQRQMQPLFQIEWLFRLLPIGSEQKRCLSILHNFTDQVVRERKIEHEKCMVQQKSESPNRKDEFNSKKPRLAFLDLLIEASQDGKALSDRDIREEVDTFMFEGHDTTAAAINFSLFLIGNYPEVQKKVNEELDRVFGYSDRPITMADLNEVKYLECCIKEALRLYPSVPAIARQLMEDTDICGYNLPAGATVTVTPFLFHRDPKNFPDPESFKPERFFPENVQGRHPYVYVPFSAGPRNCIGQKFAMMEEKIILASILRHFHVKALDKPEDIHLLSELILRPRDGIRVQLTPKTRSN